MEQPAPANRAKADIKEARVGLEPAPPPIISTPIEQEKGDDGGVFSHLKTAVAGHHHPTGGTTTSSAGGGGSGLGLGDRQRSLREELPPELAPLAEGVPSNPENSMAGLLESWTGPTSPANHPHARPRARGLPPVPGEVEPRASNSVWGLLRSWLVGNPEGTDRSV